MDTNLLVKIRQDKQDYQDVILISPISERNRWYPIHHRWKVGRAVDWRGEP